MSGNKRSRIAHILGLSSIGILLSLLILLLNILLISKIILFSNDSMHKNIIAFDYSNFVFDELYENDGLKPPLDLTKRVYKDVISYSVIHTDICLYLDATLLGEAYTIDTEEMEYNLRNNIRIGLIKANHSMTDNDRAIINHFVDSFITEYSKQIKIPVLEHYIKIKRLFNEIFVPASIVIIISIVSIILILFKINFWFHSFLQFVAHCLLNAAVLTAGITVYGILSHMYEKIYMAPVYFTNSTQILLKGYFQAMITSSIVIVLIWAAMSVISEHVRANAHA